MISFCMVLHGFSVCFIVFLVACVGVLLITPNFLSCMIVYFVFVFSLKYNHCFPLPVFVMVSLFVDTFFLCLLVVSILFCSIYYLFYVYFVGGFL
jgi:hypothetical protein